MTLFFLVVGLEAKRQLDLGELRERRRLAIPIFAAIGGIAVLVALGLIATVYAGNVSLVAVSAATALFVALVGLRYAPFGRRAISIGLAAGIWIALFSSGSDPAISGLAIGLATSAYPPSREDLERATKLTRSFREQPTPGLARSAQHTLQATISPNERLQYELHPWSSYVIVPLFALANAGIHLTGGLIGDALSSPITLGIVLGYVVGKPIGVVAGHWIATRPVLHGPRSPLSEPVVVAAGACAGIGFTVSLLIASLAFDGRQFDEARLGVFATVLLSPIVAWLVTRVVRRLPSAVRARQIGRTAEDVLDLADDVDPERDHIRGPDDAPVTLVEYGDFECPYWQAETVIRELLAEQGDDVRYVWRHLPLNDVHPGAQLAAEASEAAAAQGNFWEMYDELLAHQDELTLNDLTRYANELALDVERFDDERLRRTYASRIAADVASADEAESPARPRFSSTAAAIDEVRSLRRRPEPASPF